MSLIDQLVIVPLGEEWRVIGPVLLGEIEPYDEPEQAVTYYAWAQPITVHRGRFDEPAPGHYLTAAASIGKIGQASAATVATHAVSRWKPERVLLLGIAGSLDPAWVRLGDVVAPDLVFGYEVEEVSGNPPESRYRPDGYQAGAVLIDQVRALRNDVKAYAAWQADCLAAAPAELRAPVEARPPELHVLPMASGNQVVKSAEQGRRLRAAISPLIGAVEMEAAGVFHAAWRGVHRPDVLMVRGISDLADENKTRLEEETHDAWRAFAAGNAARLVRALWRRRTLTVAAPPISPPFLIQADLAHRSMEHFLRKDPITRAPEITIRYQESDSHALAFLDVLKRRGATPELRFTVRAWSDSGEPAPRFRVQVVTEQGGSRIVDQAREGMHGVASFPIEATDDDLRVDLMIAAPSSLQRLRFELMDFFSRTAEAEWVRP